MRRNREERGKERPKEGQDVNGWDGRPSGPLPFRHLSLRRPYSLLPGVLPPPGDGGLVSPGRSYTSDTPGPDLTVDDL